MTDVTLHFDLPATARVAASSLSEALDAVRSGRGAVELERAGHSLARRAAAHEAQRAALSGGRPAGNQVSGNGVDGNADGRPGQGERAGVVLTGCVTPDGKRHDLRGHGISSSVPVMMIFSDGQPLMTEAIGRRLAVRLERRLGRAVDMAAHHRAESGLRASILKEIGELADHADRARSLEEAREDIRRIARLAAKGSASCRDMTILDRSRQSIEAELDRLDQDDEARLEAASPVRLTTPGADSPGPEREKDDRPEADLAPGASLSMPARRQRRVVMMP